MLISFLDARKFGKLSARMGVVTGALLSLAWAASLPGWLSPPPPDASQSAFGFAPFFSVIAAVPLLLGGIRTLRARSGGLRILCGAWGLVLGLFAAPLSPVMPKGFDALVHETYYLVPSALTLILMAVAMLGLMLTILHKEK